MKEVGTIIESVVNKLQNVKGIVGVVLGGSRAKGTHTPKSDIDIGIYYESEDTFDLREIGRIAKELDDSHRDNLITGIGEWGSWINGGGWLTINEIPVGGNEIFALLSSDPEDITEAIRLLRELVQEVEQIAAHSDT